MRIISKSYEYYDWCECYGVDKSIKYVRTKKDITVNIAPEINLTVKDSWKGLNYYPGLIGFCGKMYLFYKVTYEAGHWRPEYVTLLGDDIFELPISEHDKYQIKRLQGSDIDDKYFIEYNAPVFSIMLPRTYFHKRQGTYEVTVNPELTSIGFHRYVEPVDAWQQLSMFIPRLSIETPEEPSNEIKIQSHGFDKKSFRNM